MTPRGEAILAQGLAVIAAQLSVLAAVHLDEKGRQMQKSQLEQFEKNVNMLVTLSKPSPDVA